MLRLAVAGLLRRPASTLAVGLALMAATLGFSLIQTVAATTRATLTGDIQQAWKTPYDILVRPPGAQAELETNHGLVRPNFVAGLRGGITLDDLASLRAIGGVDVAAPVALVGFVNWPMAVEIPLADASEGGTSLYRITATITGDAGLSTYPVDTRYVLIAEDGELSMSTGGLDTGAGTASCTGAVNCFAGSVCQDGACEPGAWPSTADARYYLPLLQPIPIAGVDPLAEAQLAGLDDCVDSGRYLRDDDRLSDGGDPDSKFTSLPVLLSHRSFNDQELDIRIDQAPAIPPGPLVPAGIDGWQERATERRSLADLYVDFIPSLHDYLDPWPLWSAGDVSYEVRGPRHLRAAEGPGQDPFASAPLSTEYGVDNRVLIPPETIDTSFRDVSVHADVVRPAPGSAFRWKRWDVVGTYDPTCLRGFDPLAGGPLETYSYPAVELANGDLLPPSRSMSGYVNSPPLVLTTLEGAEWLSDPQRYDGQPGDAFISVVRVRARGAEVASEDAYAGLQRLAAEIERVTGLRADVVKGASPDVVAIDLPAGRFGRPALTVTEGWSVKGVAVAFVRAVAVQDVAVSLVGLSVCTALTAVTASASVQRRRREFATMRALGWPRRWISRLVGLELLLLGGAAGIAAAICTLAVGLAAGTLDYVLLVAAASLPPMLSLVAATWVLRWAWRVPSAAAMRGAGAGPRQSRTTSILAVSILDLRYRSPSLAAMAIGCVAAGALLVGATVFISTGFDGQLDSTALGVHLSVAVTPYHWVMSALVMIGSGLAAWQVIALAAIEQRPLLAMTRALGWSRARVVQLVGAQSVSIGLVGGSAAAVALVIGGTALGRPGLALAIGMGVIALSIMVASLAAASTLLAVYRLAPAQALRGE